MAIGMPGTAVRLGFLLIGIGTAAVVLGDDKAEYDAAVVVRKQITILAVKPGDWPQWLGSSLRNNTVDAKDLPTDWDIDTKTNIKWSVPLGSNAFGNPVVANGQVYVGTNNGAAYLERFPDNFDLGCLLCFDEKTGKFLWQHSAPTLLAGRDGNWPFQGICSAPYVEGDRLWCVTNRCEVACLDTAGFYDNENDGPYKLEANEDQNEADVVWVIDMIGLLNLQPRQMSNCSITAAGDTLFVCTSNGVNLRGQVQQVQAPSFMAVNKHSGKILWTDNSPGGNILNGQWSSPAYGVLGGVPQVLFGGGDGWLYSFDPQGNGRGEAKLLWKFDCNPKESYYMLGGRATRNHLIGTPVIDDGRIYIGVGEDPEHGEGVGRLWCIDPTKRGDVSPELVFNQANPDQPIRPKRVQACEPDKGDLTRANPNSAAVWEYTTFDQDGDGKIAFDKRMHRTCGSVAIQDGLLFVADFSGLLHCIDCRTGIPFWTHDMAASSWGTPLIADGKVYMGDEDGDVSIFALSKQKTLINTASMGNAVYTTPIAQMTCCSLRTRTSCLQSESRLRDRKSPTPTLAEVVRLPLVPILRIP